MKVGMRFFDNVVKSGVFFVILKCHVLYTLIWQGK